MIQVRTEKETFLIEIETFQNSPDSSGIAAL